MQCLRVVGLYEGVVMCCQVSCIVSALLFCIQRPPPVRPLREDVAELDHMTDRHQYKQMMHVKLVIIREDLPIGGLTWVDFG